MTTSKKSSFENNTLLLSVGTFVNKGLQFLCIPFFSRWLSTEEYGRFDLFYTYVPLLLPIITLSTQEAVFRLSINRDTNTKKENATNDFCFDIINYLIVVCVLFLVLFKRETALFFPFALYLLSELLSTYLRGFLRSEKRLDIYSISMAFSSVCIVFLVPIFIRAMHLGVRGILLGYGLGTMAGDLLVIFWSKWHTMIDVTLLRIDTIRALLHYSLPLVPNDLSWWVMNTSDRQIINWFFGDASNGVYAIAHKIPALCSVVFNMASLSWQQEIVEQIDKPDKNTFINNVFEKYLVMLFSICSGLLSGSYILYYYIFDAKYFSAILYSPVLILAASMTAISQFFGGIQIALKKPRQNGLTTIIGAVINVIIHLIMIKAIGLFAACVSTLVANIIVAGTRLYLIRETYHVVFTRKMLISIMLYGYFFAMTFFYENIILSTVNLILACILFVVMNRRVLNGFLRH